MFYSNNISYFSENYLLKKWYSLKYRFTMLAKKNREQGYIHYEHLKFLMNDNNRLNLPLKRKRLQDVAKNDEITSTSYSNLQLPEDPSRELAATTPPEQDCVRSTPEFNQTNMDVDEAFFLSIMPNVKKLSDEEKLEFRVRVLNAVKSVSTKPEKKNISYSAVKSERDITTLD